MGVHLFVPRVAVSVKNDSPSNDRFLKFHFRKLVIFPLQKNSQSQKSFSLFSQSDPKHDLALRFRPPALRVLKLHFSHFLFSRVTSAE